MKAINPYLNFPGNTEEAFNFYRSVFGGEFRGGVSRFKDTPDGKNLSAEDSEKIMHIALPMGHNMMMATDALESMGQKVNPGNNFYLAIEADDKAEADKLFNLLKEGGKTEMEMQDTFWGDYFGMLQDKFGIRWMIGYTYPKNK